jgi:hypothetical protein
MDPGEDSNKGTVDPSFINSTENTFFIFSHIEEPETVGEGYFANDIKGIALQPML